MKGKVTSILKRIVFILGVLQLIFILLSFTSLPYWAYYGLASVDDKLTEKPQTIIIMGGDGMPSPSGLMRLYNGINKAKEYNNAAIILALPYNESDSTRQLNLMAHEMVLKGIDTNRIAFAPNGFNTRSQALELKQLCDTLSPTLLISSPEHMFRCLASFKKVGFKNIGGSPSFEKPSDEERLKNKNKKENLEVDNLSLRYNMWSYMQYEIIVLREYTAITYYWFKDWI